LLLLHRFVLKLLERRFFFILKPTGKNSIRLYDKLYHFQHLL
jgi:hypothetical protein